MGMMLWGMSSLAAGVPSGSVEQQHSVGSLGDVAGSFVEMELHRFGVGEGQRQRPPDASSGTKKASKR